MSTYTCILQVELDVATNHVKNTMAFQTFLPPTSTYTCDLQVQLDVATKNYNKTVSLKCRVPLVFYKCNSTFSPSDFWTTRLSNIDFDLYFTGQIRCFLKKTWISLSKSILFDSWNSPFSALRPFGPPVSAWVSHGCLLDPSWLEKLGSTERKQHIFLKPSVSLT